MEKLILHFNIQKEGRTSKKKEDKMVVGSLYSCSLSQIKRINIEKSFSNNLVLLQVYYY